MILDTLASMATQVMLYPEVRAGRTLNWGVYMAWHPLPDERHPSRPRLREGWCFLPPGPAQRRPGGVLVGSATTNNTDAGSHRCWG